jgi:formylglycine-generating enzyme required for sulfatase activity
VWITRSFEIQETEGAIVDPYDYRNTIRNFSTWRSAAKGCNALSRYANLPECYTCDAYDCTNTVQDIRDCKGFRLPTEAEWEYAYRAGTTTQFYHGNLMDDWKQTVTDRAACFKEDQWLDDYAVYYYTAPGQEYATRPKTKLPNAWGLYDMAGNMQEWVHDTYVEHLGTTTAVDPINEGGTKHFVRGGRAEQKPARLRGAYRRGNPTTFTTGLRCVRTL